VGERKDVGGDEGEGRCVQTGGVRGRGGTSVRNGRRLGRQASGAGAGAASRSRSTRGGQGGGARRSRLALARSFCWARSCWALARCSSLCWTGAGFAGARAGRLLGLIRPCCWDCWLAAAQASRALPAGLTALARKPCLQGLSMRVGPAWPVLPVWPVWLALRGCQAGASW